MRSCRKHSQESFRTISETLLKYVHPILLLCVTITFHLHLVYDNRMKGSDKVKSDVNKFLCLVCDMKMNGRYKIEYKACFVCDMEVEKY